MPQTEYELMNGLQKTKAVKFSSQSTTLPFCHSDFSLTLAGKGEN
jgi:hypothetical protein